MKKKKIKIDFSPPKINDVLYIIFRFNYLQMNNFRRDRQEGVLQLFSFDFVC